MAEASIGRRVLGEIEETSLDEVCESQLFDCPAVWDPTDPRHCKTGAARISREVQHELLSPISVGPSPQILQQPNSPSLTQTSDHEIADPQDTQILSVFRKSLNSTTRDQLAQGGSSPTAGILTARGTHAGPPDPSRGEVNSYPIQDLDRLVTQHFRATQSAPLSLSGRYLPLIYLLVATLIAAPHNKAVVVIDVEGRFDITRVTQCVPHQDVPAPTSTVAAEDNGHTTEQLRNAGQGRQGGTDDRPMIAPARKVTPNDLKHVHVYRPARGSPSHTREVLSAAEDHMIYSRHASIAREWWGSIVIGGGSPAVLGPDAARVTTGWRGWLRVDRENVRGFGLGISMEEALLDRDRRQRAVNDAGWTANCVWGGFNFNG